MDGVELTEAVLENTDFVNAIMPAAVLSGAQLTTSDFSGASLNDAFFIGTQARASSFAGAALTGADFTSADFSTPNPDQQLRNDFSSAVLVNANFTDTNLTGAWFGGANLQGANFTGATLVGAAFPGADLRGVDLPVEAFDSRGRPRFTCDRNTKRSGALRAKLRPFCKGVRNVIYLQAK